jgi:hypothetical protein
VLASVRVGTQVNEYIAFAELGKRVSAIKGDFWGYFLKFPPEEILTRRPSYRIEYNHNTYGIYANFAGHYRTQ